MQRTDRDVLLVRRIQAVIGIEVENAREIHVSFSHPRPSSLCLFSRQKVLGSEELSEEN